MRFDQGCQSMWTPLRVFNGLKDIVDNIYISEIMKVAYSLIYIAILRVQTYI